MFTKNVADEGLRSRLLGVLAGPHGVDRYTELVDPMWTSEVRASVVRVRRTTPRTVTLWLQPNHPVRFTPGQYLTVTVEIDGRRHTRCYSPANAAPVPLIELTVTRHDGGLVSEYLHANARPGMALGLSGPAGDFTLADPLPRRLVLIAGGSGITPVMSMIRTLQESCYTGEVAVLYYVRTLDDACYLEQLALLPDVRVLYGCTRGPGGDLEGHFDGRHLAAALGGGGPAANAAIPALIRAMEDPDAVYVCGPPSLVEAVRSVYPAAVAESFAPAPLVIPDSPGGGRVTFSASGIDVDDDGRPLLDQAESAGLKPQSGCRMGICHTCTRRKVHGVVRNVTTGAVSGGDDEAVQICVSAPVGDVAIEL